MVAPPFPMMISGSLPAEIVTDVSPAFSSAGSSEWGGGGSVRAYAGGGIPTRRGSGGSGEGGGISQRRALWFGLLGIHLLSFLHLRRDLLVFNGGRRSRLMRARRNSGTKEVQNHAEAASQL